MTVREVEVYIEGQRDRDDWLLEVLAWVQANLINVHVPRGKARVKPDSLLPRSARRRKGGADEAPETLAALDAGGDPKARLAAMKERARARQDREDAERFAASTEGRRMMQLLGEEDT